MFQENGDESKTRYAFIEHFESEEALAEHAGSAHIKAFQAANKDLVDSITVKTFLSCGY